MLPEVSIATDGDLTAKAANAAEVLMQMGFSAGVTDGALHVGSVVVPVSDDEAGIINQGNDDAVAAFLVALAIGATVAVGDEWPVDVVGWEDAKKHLPSNGTDWSTIAQELGLAPKPVSVSETAAGDVGDGFFF